MQDFDPKYLFKVTNSICLLWRNLKIENTCPLNSELIFNWLEEINVESKLDEIKEDIKEMLNEVKSWLKELVFYQYNSDSRILFDDITNFEDILNSVLNSKSLSRKKIKIVNDKFIKLKERVSNYKIGDTNLVVS